MAYKRKRGKCPWCSHRHALTNRGRLWAHNDTRTGHLCRGTGQVPS